MQGDDLLNRRYSAPKVPHNISLLTHSVEQTLGCGRNLGLSALPKEFWARVGI